MRPYTLSFRVERRICRALRAGAALVLALGIVACAPRVHNQGTEVDPERLSKIEVGKTNRDQVLEILGSPSNSSSFGPEVWYYINQRVHSTLFFQPEVDDRKVVVLAFDENGVVSDIETVGLADGRKVTPVDRVTPTAGHELTIFEQVLGNFGRFTKKPQKPGPGGGGLPPR